MEVIKSVENLETKYMSGYRVVTTEQEIELLIADAQNCCENWGYFWSNDDPESFVGAEVYGVTLTDDALNTDKLPNIYEGGVMFVSISTSKGVLQFVAYNEHNGYYGHEATVSSKQLTYSEVL